MAETVLRLGRILCGLGIHRWKYVGMDLFGHQAYMCKRPYCRTCKQDMWVATVLWERTEVLAGDLPASLPEPFPVPEREESCPSNSKD